MKNPKSREKVELYLNEAVRKDRLKVHPEGWSALGLFELTRQKKGLPLAKYIAADCACCHGADASFVWPVLKEEKCIFGRSAICIYRLTKITI